MTQIFKMLFSVILVSFMFFQTESKGEENVPLLLPSPVERIPVNQAIKSLVDAVEEVIAVENFCNKYYSFKKIECEVNVSASDFKPMDCAGLYYAGYRKSGVYSIYYRNSWMTKMEAKVYCDMETDGGGWTVIQRRGTFPTDPAVNFTRNWADYSKGFGNLHEEFWLGNENIHRLTTQDSVILRVDIQDFAGTSGNAKFGAFYIGGYKDDYILTVGSYSGTIGDSMKYHNGYKFATYDRDNSNNCAKNQKGGWWYYNCHYANLNGINLGQKTATHGISWYHWKSNYDSYKWVEMKIRPTSFVTI